MRREQLARLMMLKSAQPLDDIDILTLRENAVMHKALLGNRTRRSRRHSTSRSRR
jgi:hypothetical protein